MNEIAGKPYTRIGTPGANIDELKMRGRDVLDDILGTKSFSEAFYFMATGRDLAPAHVRLFDACLVILMDHGLTPSALIARMMHDANPTELQMALAAGMMTVGPKYAGTINGAAALFSAGLQEQDKEAWAARVAAESRESRRPVPGYGHRHYHEHDPRAVRLIGIARECEVEGRSIELAYLLEAAIEVSRGRRMVLNVTGALGAVLNEIGFPVKLMRSVSAVGRVAGLVGHVAEEAENPLTPALFAFGNSIEYRE